MDCLIFCEWQRVTGCRVHMCTIFTVLMGIAKGTLGSFSLLVLVPLCSLALSLDLLPTNSEFPLSLSLSHAFIMFLH